jgi:Spy/CpxP family protein refolding chaperone
MISARSIGIFGVATVFAAVAHAQMPQVGSVPGVMGMGGGQSPIMILMAPAVQTELKLTDDQKTKIYTLAQESGKRSREIVQEVFMPNADPMRMRAAGMALREANDHALAKVLKSSQKSRLDEIVLRYEGPLATVQPDIAKKLKMSTTQNQKVQGIIMALAVEQRQMAVTVRQNGNYTNRQRDVITQQSAKLRETAVQQIAKVLTRKQKDEFNRMLGEPFDLSKIDPDRISTADAEKKKDASSLETEKKGASDGEKKETPEAEKKRGPDAEKKKDEAAR